MATHDRDPEHDDRSVPDGAPRHRVLFVDDEPAVLRALQRLLRREPYEVLTTESAEHAITIMEETPAALIVTDQRMPEMTGTELLAIVRERWPETLQIVLSGYSEINAILEAVNQGALYKFLTKPWNDEELRLQIRRALEHADLRAENRHLVTELKVRNAHITELNARLQEQAADATRGLDCCHDILETADVGIVTVDQEGVIVNANGSALNLLRGNTPVVIGSVAACTLPNEVVAAIHTCGTANNETELRRVTVSGCTYQWRVRALAEQSARQGVVITIWKDAA